MRYLIYFLIAYLPWQLALNPVRGVDLASIRVLIIGVFLIWFGRKLINPSKFSLVKFGMASPISFGLLFFLFFAGISIFFNQKPSWGLRKFLYLCSIFPLYFVISDVSINLKFNKIIKILTWTAVIISIIALIQFGLQFFIKPDTLIDFWATKVGPLFYGQSFGDLVAQNLSWSVEINGQFLLRGIATFPDPHMLSFFLGMILPFSLIKLFKKKFSKSNLLICFVLLAGLLLTFARGGYLGLIASCCVLLICLWSFLSAQQKKRLMVFGFLLILILIIFAKPIASRFYSIFDWQEGSNAARIKIWQESFRVWQKYPLFGVGLGNYPIEINPSVPYRSPITSHNLYLDILAELGFFALLIWLGLIFGTIVRLGRGAAGRMNMIGLMASLTYFSVHSFFETAMFNPVILALLMVILGLSVRAKLKIEN